MQFTIVSDVPFASGGAFLATSVANSGESGMTAILHVNRNAKNKMAELQESSHGEMMQQRHDRDNAMVAVFLTPMRCEMIPPKTQAMLPTEIMAKDIRGTLKSTPGYRLL